MYIDDIDSYVPDFDAGYFRRKYPNLLQDVNGKDLSDEELTEDYIDGALDLGVAPKGYLKKCCCNRCVTHNLYNRKSAKTIY